MDGPFIAECASLIGDPARANMLAALMDGRALSATELGLAARVAPSTASGHLAKLVDGRLLSVISSGRNRYFKLASPTVARVLEQLMVLAGEGPPRYRPPSRCGEEMARARTCYDHFAGRLGVALADSLTSRGFVRLGDDGGLVTDEGAAFLAGLGLAIEPPRPTRRPLCRPCLDWSERRWHIGGSLGAALTLHCFEAGWTERKKESRAVAVTAAGARAFEDLFGVSV